MIFILTQVRMPQTRRHVLVSIEVYCQSPGNSSGFSRSLNGCSYDLWVLEKHQHRQSLRKCLDGTIKSAVRIVGVSAGCCCCCLGVDRQSCRRLTRRRVQWRPNGALNELTYASSTCLRRCIASLCREFVPRIFAVSVAFTCSGSPTPYLDPTQVLRDDAACNLTLSDSEVLPSLLA